MDDTFTWRLAARTVACVNLGLTCLCLALSIVSTISSLQHIKLETYVLLYGVRIVGIITAILLLKCTSKDFKTKWALKGTWLWFLVNLALVVLMVLIFSWKVEPIAILVEIIVRSISLFLIMCFIRELRILNGSFSEIDGGGFS